MKPINLSPLYRQAQRRQQRHLRKVSIAVGGYLILMVAAYVGLVMFDSSDNEVVASKLENAQEEYQRINIEMQKMMPAINEYQMTLEASRAVSVHPNWANLLAILAQEMQQEIVMHNITINGIEPPKTTVQISVAQPLTTNPTAVEPQKNHNTAYILELRGYALNQNNVTQFVLKLEQLNLFDRVTLVSTSQQTLANGTVFRFGVKCEIGHVEEGNHE